VNRGQSSPLGANLTPGVTFRFLKKTGLWPSSSFHSFIFCLFSASSGVCSSSYCRSSWTFFSLKSSAKQATGYLQVTSVPSAMHNMYVRIVTDVKILLSHEQGGIKCCPDGDQIFPRGSNVIIGSKRFYSWGQVILSLGVRGIKVYLWPRILVKKLTAHFSQKLLSMYIPGSI
jgi:hypothetical protein